MSAPFGWDVDAFNEMNTQPKKAEPVSFVDRLVTALSNSSVVADMASGSARRRERNNRFMPRQTPPTKEEHDAKVKEINAPIVLCGETKHSAGGYASNEISKLSFDNDVKTKRTHKVDKDNKVSYEKRI